MWYLASLIVASFSCVYNIMSKNNINAKNVNTRNFNYHTLSRDGIRGGMEWVTMPQRDWGWNG